MAITLVKLRGRVRNKLRDVDGKAAGPNQVEVDMALADAYLAIAADLPAPTLYTASALTIAAGTDLFTLPITVSGSGYGTGTVEYAGQVDLQLARTGQFLSRKTVDELHSFRNGAPSVLLGVPQLFALYEDSSNVVRGRCYPGAQQAEACHLYATLEPDDLRDYVGAGGTEGLDTVTVNLSRTGAAALVDYAAAQLVAKMTDAALAQRGLNPNAATLWMQEADRLLYQDAARRLAVESNGETQRRVP